MIVSWSVIFIKHKNIKYKVMEEKQDMNEMFRSGSEQRDAPEVREITAGLKSDAPKAKSGFWGGMFEFIKTLPVSSAIVLINILMYLIMLFNDVNLLSSTGYDYIKWGANFGPLTLTGEWWRVISCCFIHKGLPHLVNNMLLLLLMGWIVEIIFGKRRYAYAYIVTGLFSSYFSLLFHPEISSVGASGAVFGIVGLLLSGIFFNKNMTEFRKGFIGPMLGMLAINLLYGFSNKTIDLASHIGGFLTGFVLGAFYALLDRLVSKEKVTSYQNVMEMFFVLLFIFLLGNMASNVPAKYILMKRQWDAGVIEKIVERKKAEKRATSMSECSINFNVLIKKTV